MGVTGHGWMGVAGHGWVMIAWMSVSGIGKYADQVHYMHRHFPLLQTPSVLHSLYSMLVFVYNWVPLYIHHTMNSADIV